MTKVATGTLVTYLGELVSNTHKIMLLKNTYTPNADHKFVSDLVAHECDATGYVGGYGGAGRKTVGSKTFTEDAANDRAVLDAADPAPWTALGGTVDNTLGKVALIEEVGGSDATARVLCTLNFVVGGTPTPRNTNGGDFSVTFDALGIIHFNC
jgi:hypothetical protein